VSIVVLNRNGESLLRQLLPALRRTAYSPFELIVVDNGSVDGSVAYLEASASPIPIRIVRNPGNAPFGAANDQGVAEATGELVLLLNNDVEPVHPGWLGHLVSTVIDGGATAAGARLVYPRRTRPRAGAQHPDLSLQHRGVQFVLEGGLAVPRVLGAGEDPFGPAATALEEVPALTAACFLVRRETYQAIGGFSSGYDYGWEDMDLCLRLRATGGHLVCDGRAVLLHHESATRVRADAAAARTRLEGNRARFHATWGPRLYREVLLDAIDGTGHWTRSPLRVDVIGGSASDGSVAPDLVAGMAALGWEARWVRHLPATGRSGRGFVNAGCSAVVVSLDPGLDVRRVPDAPVTIAWPDGPAEAWIGTPWFDH
jgi:GT2 family glycosyltransferase